MFQCKDQLGRKILLQRFPPKRIISLVPSQTELLYDLGLDKEVVGITKFCVHPENWFRSKTRVGGTKTVNIEKIQQLQPDLIIANKEENVKEQILALENIAPVWVSDVNNLDDALKMISVVGEMVDRTGEAKALVARIDASFLNLKAKISNKQYSVCYLIW